MRHNGQNPGHDKSQELARWVGARIRELRHQRGWQQVDLEAHLDGKPKQSMLSAIETGRRFPSYSTLVKIIEVFEIEPACLFLQPEQDFRHQVVEAVLNSSESTLGHVAKLVDVVKNN